MARHATINATRAFRGTRKTWSSMGVPSCQALVDVVRDLLKVGGAALGTKSKNHIAGELAFANELCGDRTRSTTRRVSDDGVSKPTGDDYPHARAGRRHAIPDEVVRNALIPMTNHRAKVTGLHDSVATGKHGKG